MPEVLVSLSLIMRRFVPTTLLPTLLHHLEISPKFVKTSSGSFFETKSSDMKCRNEFRICTLEKVQRVERMSGAIISRS